MKRVTKTDKYKNFDSWDPRYVGSFDSEEFAVYDYFYNNVFKNKDNGFIIDIGANDGVTISHSLPFIDKGWSALMIEPNPHLFEKMSNLYSHLNDVICINSAVTEENMAPTKLFLGSSAHQGHSTIVESETKWPGQDQYWSNEFVYVQCNTLENIMIDNNIQKHIDILHIDAEGKTLDILGSFDFQKYRPSYISVDVLTQDFDPDRHKLKEIMDKANYKFILSKGQSIWEDNSGN